MASAVRPWSNRFISFDMVCTRISHLLNRGEMILELSSEYHYLNAMFSERIDMSIVECETLDSLA